MLGGNETVPGQFPYVAAVLKFRSDGYAKACGGTILDENWILTAAHCVYLVEKNNIEIWAGMHSIRDKEDEDVIQMRGINSYYVHRKYRR